MCDHLWVFKCESNWVEIIWIFLGENEKLFSDLKNEEPIKILL